MQSFRPFPETHDVVVVGSRCAGAATAMLMARMGHDVVVLERTEFPSDTLSTHLIARSGVVQLQRWGLLDAVLATGAPALRRVAFHTGGEVVSRQIKDRAGVDHLVAPRRHVLDALLADAAVEAGADVRFGVSVDGVTRDGDGRVDGVTGHDADGNDVQVRARFVIGADGLGSRIARSVGAPITDERHRHGAVRYAYVAGFGGDQVEFHLAEGLFAGVFPTPGDEANVWVCGTDDSLGRPGAGDDRAQRFVELLHRASPELAARVQASHLTSPVRAFSHMPNQLRQPAGPGWALVGDASYFRDAITGHGMSDAFRDAELLSRTLDGVLRGDTEEADAMARYTAERDQLVAEIFEITCRLAEHPSVAEFVDLQRRLSAAVEEEAQRLAALPPARFREPAWAA
jgi:flavin-dependent dehydrogenase